MNSIKQIINEEFQTATDKVMAIDEILGLIFLENPTSLSENEKIFVYVENLEKEINNGGFSQFFFNSAGNFSQEMLNALKTIGADKTSNLLEKAMEQFPGFKVPKDRELRQDIIEKIENEADEIWSELEDKFYLYEDNIAELLIKFIEQNIKDFNN